MTTIQEFRVRDLPTRTVTLFPTQAQVVRDIKDVVLQPGINQITVVGFSPTVDENSIKVEGTGAAIISDIAVELLPNRDIFQDVYPDDSDDDDSESDDDDDDDTDAAVPEPDDLVALRHKVQLAEDDAARAAEAMASAASRLTYLDAYGAMLDRKRGVDIGAGIETYRTERATVFADHIKASGWQRQISVQLAALQTAMARATRRHNKTQRAAARARAHVTKAQRRDRAQRDRRKAEAAREKARIHAERQKYWPRKCYTVRITLDAPTFGTPSSSRRSSVASLAEFAAPAVPSPDEAGVAVDTGAATCDLAISYVTSSAFWAPTYDLQLSTTSSTASLCFDAQLTNTTSESWTDCKVVLSTSQTALSGLNDAIPELVPWRVKLGRGSGAEAILHSRDELVQKSGWRAAQKAHLVKLPPRDALFGVDSDYSDQLFAPYATYFSVDNNDNNNDNNANNNNAPRARRLDTRMAPQSSLFATAFSSTAPGAEPLLHGRAVQFGTADDDADSRTLAVPELAFAESSFEETGMTTTYDLPARKTLVPGATASKQRVARTAFTGVAFSHTVVAKYRPVAYLRATLRNTSSRTLLRGAAGLTLDGAFLGRATLPLCSAGDTFALSLGVDPAIRVAYPKPDVTRATTGIFTKEDSSAYKRAVVLSNTRAAARKAVALVVLDQVPVSEDDRVRVDVQQPRGLTVGGGAVAADKGVSASQDWGTATAVLKKAGEVEWEVTLNAGKTVRLALEYDVTVPTGDSVVQC